MNAIESNYMRDLKRLETRYAVNNILKPLTVTRLLHVLESAPPPSRPKARPKRKGKARPSTLTVAAMMEALGGAPPAPRAAARRHAAKASPSTLTVDKLMEALEGAATAPTRLPPARPSAKADSLPLVKLSESL